MNVRGKITKLSFIGILMLFLIIQKAYSSGHKEKHKKVIIHVPVHKKIEKHTHTIIKHIHHHHKPVVVKEEKKIIEEHHHPIIKKEHVSHDHHHHHDAKHEHKHIHEYKHEHKKHIDTKPLEYDEIEEEHVHHHHNYEHKMHDDEGAATHNDYYERY